MAIRLSTAARNAMLKGGLQAAMANGKLMIRSGPQPSGGDSAEQGTLLMEITIDAGAFAHGSPTNGLNMDDPVAGVLSKIASDIWRGLGLTLGTAGHYRYVCNPADDGTARSDLVRVDGSCGGSGSGADAILSSTTIAEGQSVTCDQFNITMPAG